MYISFRFTKTEVYSMARGLLRFLASLGTLEYRVLIFIIIKEHKVENIGTMKEITED